MARQRQTLTLMTDAHTPVGWVPASIRLPEKLAGHASDSVFLGAYARAGLCGFAGLNYVGFMRGLNGWKPSKS